MSSNTITQVFGPDDARQLVERAAQHVPEWDIEAGTRPEGGTTLRGYVRGNLVWAAYELAEPVGNYRWMVYAIQDGDFPAALVWDSEAAHLWLARELQNELLIAKVVAA